MALFGRDRRIMRELAHEVLRPLRIDVDNLVEHSRHNFETEVLRVVKNGREDALYTAQKDWKVDEGYEDQAKWQRSRK